MDHDEILLKIATHPKALGLFFTPAKAFMLIAQLQLALRHPDNVGDTALIARQLAEQLAEFVCREIPEAREVIDRGWQPCYDMSRDYYNAEFRSVRRDQDG
jgi:hypothetical protein